MTVIVLECAACGTQIEMLRKLTLRLRRRLNAIDNAIAEAQDLLGEVEEAACLVAEDGSRKDGQEDSE